MTTHTREKALDDRNYELLVEGAQRLDGSASLEARFLVLVGGRLGLRPGEIMHMRESWVDWRRRRIVVPRQQGCRLGIDGGICGYCRSQAKQMVTHHTPGETSVGRLRFYNRHVEGGFDQGDELTLDKALQMRWFSKTPAAAREVPFGWDPRTELAVERLFDQRDRWGVSKGTLDRRLEWSLEAADEIGQDSTTPHGLRGTAATYHAGHGVGLLALQSMFGWSSLQTARRYIKESPDNTERELHAAHSI